MDRSLPGSSVYGIFQARVLEWGAIAFSNPALLLSGIITSLCLSPSLHLIQLKKKKKKVLFLKLINGLLICYLSPPLECIFQKADPMSILLFSE